MCVAGGGAVRGLAHKHVAKRVTASPAALADFCELASVRSAKEVEEGEEEKRRQSRERESV